MNSARGDSSTGSELKAVEEACREASRTVEPCELCVSVVKKDLGMDSKLRKAHLTDHSGR